ncbi:dodecin family protein [Christiangramia sp.]|uniref:dodecin family protein n=1 Tax=Christiangramia sp. TaxID=1931228 RepID=UPI0026028DB6|nr:dodecin family protein [Christiangramia sp.]
MSIVKVIEVLATSSESFEAATKEAVKEAAKTVKNIQSVYVKDMNAKVEDGAIVSYGVTAKISFTIN